MSCNGALATAENSVLLVVDLQEKLLPVIADNATLIARTQLLLRGAAALRLPVMVSEQYPQGLGGTVAEIAACLPPETTILPKRAFSCLEEPALARALAETGRTHIILCGVEAHICVRLTMLDALAANYGICVAADAIGSRNPTNVAWFREEATRCGATVAGVEALLFQMLRSSTAPAFRTISKLVR